MNKGGQINSESGCSKRYGRDKRERERERGDAEGRNIPTRKSKDSVPATILPTFGKSADASAFTSSHIHAPPVLAKALG